MSGHNKWSQIKHKKAKEDAKKGQAFTKLIKEITQSARQGGGDPAGNAHLRGLLEKARAVNMPAENAQRAIKRGTGELPGVVYEEFRYEGYGPAGIAVLVDTLSDNKNRTVADMRRIFTRHGGNLAENGAVSWMFESKGVIRIPSTLTEDELVEKLLEYDIDDISCAEAICSVVCPPKSLEEIKKAVVGLGMAVESAEIELVAKDAITLSDEQSSRALALLSELQDHEDVKQVYTNLA